MKIFLCIFAFFTLLLSPSTHAGPVAKKHYVLYATLLDTLPVNLADGAQWMMDKGDTFPLVMFKDQHTRVILQLAGTNFSVATKNVRIFEEKDLTAEALANYRQNVQTYINTRAAQWKKNAEINPSTPNPQLKTLPKNPPPPLPLPTPAQPLN